MSRSVLFVSPCCGPLDPSQTQKEVQQTFNSAPLLFAHFLPVSDDFPGIPPDYDVVIFGPYLEPMFRTKSRHDDILAQLENLLVSGLSYPSLPAYLQFW